MASQQEYNLLPTTNKGHEDDTLDKSEWEYDAPDGRRPRRWFRLPHILAFVCGLLIGILGTFASPLIISSISRAFEKAHPNAQLAQPIEAVDVNDIGFGNGPRPFDPVCGNDRHEAKRAGCHFDLLATRWYADDCYHPDVLEEMLQEVDFLLFLDPERTKPAPREVALSGDWDLLWPLYDFHIMHCLYQWRRLHLAVIEHRSIDDDVYSYEHTLHCTRMLINWPNEIRYGKNTTTIINSGVSYCTPGTVGAE